MQMYGLIFGNNSGIEYFLGNVDLNNEILSLFQALRIVFYRCLRFHEHDLHTSSSIISQNLSINSY